MKTPNFIFQKDYLILLSLGKNYNTIWKQAYGNNIRQLNFFKYSISNRKWVVINYIENNYQAIEADMNSRNSTAK